MKSIKRNHRIAEEAIYSKGISFASEWLKSQVHIDYYFLEKQNCQMASHSQPTSDTPCTSAELGKDWITQVNQRTQLQHDILEVSLS